MFQTSSADFLRENPGEISDEPMSESEPDPIHPHFDFSFETSPIAELLTNIFGNLGNGLITHDFSNLLTMNGNPGDYAWGPNGLDAIITRLMNQMEGGGTPPCKKGDIEKLPTVLITQEQVENNLDCSVCQEIFKLDEETAQLPCNHFYHRDCINPWLNLHNACPICRKPVGADDTSAANNNNNDEEEGDGEIDGNNTSMNDFYVMQ